MNAQIHQTAALYLQHLDFQHYLRFGAIQSRDQFFGQTDSLWRIAHHQQIQFFIDEYVPGFDQGFDHVERLFYIGVAQIKRVHHHFLIVASFSRDIGINQHRIVVENTHL